MFVHYQPIIVTVLAAVLSVYGITIVRMTLALLRKDKTPAAAPPRDGAPLPCVSIVIPFRNEERNLGALLASLAKQTYNGETEVILIDDHSDDDGAGVVKGFMETNDSLSITIIDLKTCGVPFDDAERFKRLTTKQQALDIGVHHASHPLIAFTDADMILDPTWLTSLVNTHLSTNAALVFGHTAVIKNNLKVPVMESFQLEFLFAFARAFSKLDMTGSCMGNNILVTKDAYENIGGQRGIGYSIVEDRALMIAMRKKKLKTAATEPFRVTAKTYPSPSVKQFLNQMSRWAAGGLRPGGGLFLAGLLMFTQCAAFALTATGLTYLTILHITSGLSAEMFLPAGLAHDGSAATLVKRVIPAAVLSIITISNFLMTWLFLTISFKQSGAAVKARLFPIYYLFMLAETFVFGWMLLFKRKIIWKGRKV